MREIERSPAYKKDLKKLVRKYRDLKRTVNEYLEACALHGPASNAHRMPDLDGRPVYKQRLKLGNKGTRGGARLIFFCNSEVVRAVRLYVKTDTADIPSQSIRKALSEHDLADDDDQAT